MSDVMTHQDISARLGARVHLPDGPEAVRPGPYRGVCSDDRNPAGDLFVAVRGARYDGHDALYRLPGLGIRGVVGEKEPPLGYALPYYQVENSRRALAELAQACAGDPARKLRVFGITGTNGKSTTVRILASILEAAGRKVGWMSTVTRRLAGRETEQSLTTPEPIELAQGMQELVRAGGQDLVLEVSSHALHQERVAGIEFAGAILTNVSRDHLDYHGSIEDYVASKMRLFSALKGRAPAVLPYRGIVGIRDPHLQAVHPVRFAVDWQCDGYPTRVVHTLDGIEGCLRLRDSTMEFRSRLIGTHNLQNVLGAALLARELEIPLEAIARGIALTPPVRGRLENISSARGQVFVDYAHTPDALSNVLNSLRPMTQGRLCVVFGCGGDRDPGKRPMMGEIAEYYADVVHVTSDNPRSEAPDAIVGEVLSGMQHPLEARVEIDRRLAIEQALRELEDDDVLVVAGKGHEQEQLIGDRRLSFDDRAVILEALERSNP